MITEKEIVEILINHYPYKVTAKAIIDKIKEKNNVRIK